ncbi:MAG: hypothetical protein RLZZ546_1825 [Bacteroidota bacterium]|jgi:sarcosine oxidase subunit gamma
MIVKESPLSGKNIGSVDTVTIREKAGVPAFDLRVSPNSEAQKAIVEALGIRLPVKTGQAILTSASHLLCLAPDWWLLVGMNQIDVKLSSLVDAHHLSIVNVTGQRTTIEIKGPNAREVLSHLWEQDLRNKSFPIGSVSQGIMAKSQVIVYRLDEDCYQIMVRASFAKHLWMSLEDAAIEWV